MRAPTRRFNNVNEENYSCATGKTEKIREMLKGTVIETMDNLLDFYKEIISGFLEDGFEAELDDELGYSKYDYRSKETDDSQKRL